MGMQGKKTLTIKLIAEALEATGGFVTQAARNLDCSPRTIFRHIAKSQKLKDILADIKERYLDLAESEHIMQIKKHNYDAVKFHLRCQGKSRGYVERVDKHQPAGTDRLGEILAAFKAGPIKRGEYAGDSGQS